MVSSVASSHLSPRGLVLVLGLSRNNCKHLNNRSDHHAGREDSVLPAQAYAPPGQRITARSAVHRGLLRYQVYGSAEHHEEVSNLYSAFVYTPQVELKNGSHHENENDI